MITSKLTIKKANYSIDSDGIWLILSEIIRYGDVFAYDPKSTKKDMLAYWFSPEKQVYIAILEEEIVGTFFIQKKSAWARLTRGKCELRC